MKVVTRDREHMQAADLNEVAGEWPDWSPSWTLLPNTYDCAHEFWQELFQASFPHLGKLMKKKVCARLGSCASHLARFLHSCSLIALSHLGASLSHSISELLPAEA